MRIQGWWVLAALACQAQADELMLGMWSKHWDSATKCDELQCNEQHDLIGYAADDWFAGTYVNTLGDRSYFAGWKSGQKCIGQYLCFDLMAGAASGYGDSETVDSEIVLFIAPRAKIQLYNGLSAQVFGVPGAIMAAGLLWEF